MIQLLIHSNNFKDIAAFVSYTDFFIHPKYENQGAGEQTAIFELIIEDKKIKLSQDFENNPLNDLANEIKNLKAKNKKLKKRLKALKPKQDLSVNEILKAEIVLLKKKKYSYERIAERLNKKGYKNSRGNDLNKMQVNRLHKQYLKEIEPKQIKD